MSTSMQNDSGLTEGAARYRGLLDALEIAVQENDCDGVITYSNRAHHEILGYPAGALLGKRIWEVQPSEAEQRALEEYFQLLLREQPEPEPYLTRSQRADGTTVDLQIDWRYQRDAAGRLIGFLSTIHDVTDHRRTQETLIRRTEGLAILLEVSARLAATLDQEAILQATVDGITRLAGLTTGAVYLLAEDRSWLRLWATAPPLPPGFPEALRVIARVDHPHLGRAIAESTPLLVPDITAETLTPAEREVVEIRDLRTVLYLPLVAERDVLGALIVGSSGAPALLTGADVDLCGALANLAALTVRNAEHFEARRAYAAELERTLEERRAAEAERARLQEQLAQAERLETVGRLAGGIAHDFNNLLTAILSSVDLALPEVAPGSRVHEDLLAIQDAAEHSARLTSQLLAFARVQPAAPQVLDLNDAVDHLLRVVRRLLGERIELEWAPGAAVWPVRIDPGQLDQILVNLCVNARDALPEVGGRITVSTANLGETVAGAAEAGAAARAGEAGAGTGDASTLQELPDFRPGDYVTLTVSDNGFGMDAATRERLFEPFFTTKSLGRGTGLGLATVYGIVKQNGGLIQVCSALGEGATFTVALPRTRAPAAEPRERREPPPGRSGRGRILLAEDQPLILDLTRRMLERGGYEVLTASSGGEALRRAREAGAPIDLLVTDVVMPGMSGCELAEQLLARQPGLRVLYLSGYAPDVVIGLGVTGDGVSLLPKPFTADALLARIHELLHG